MSSSNSLQPVIDAASDSNWLRVADVACRSLKEESWKASHPSPGDWIADAASQAGYSVNAFRRQIRLAEFLREQVSASNWSHLLHSGVPFGNLELLQRLFDTDPDQARQLLPRVIKSELTHREMRKMYLAAQGAGAGNGKKLFAQRSQRFTLTAAACIRGNWSEFIGAVDPDTEIAVHGAIRGFPYARPDLTVRGMPKDPRHKPWVDAFEIKLVGLDDSRQVLVRTLEQAALLESFFRQVWLVYPKSSPLLESHEAHIQNLSAHLIHLDMQSVGVALVPEDAADDDSLEMRKIPKPNSQPSRQQLLLDHLKNWRGGVNY